MTATVFVDTNVLVYARDPREEIKRDMASTWLRGLWIEQRGRTSMQVLAEYYTTVTCKLRPGLATEAAWEDVVELLAWEPQETNRALLLRAREIERAHALSWWDAMIVAAAQLQDCDVLLSEDLQDGWRCGTVTVRNPFAERIEEARAAYAHRPVPASRHRRRGRPRSTGPAIV